MTRRRLSFPVGLGLCVAVGAVVRIWYVLAVRSQHPVIGDAYFYHHAANLLADGRGWIVPLDFLEHGQVNEAADHPPAYIAYLALWSLAGIRSETGHLLATALLGAVGVGLVGLVGRRVAGRAAGVTVGLVAAGLAAVNPNMWGWDGMGLSEPTAVIGVCLVLLAAWRLRDDPTPVSAALLGAAVGVAGLCRAELLLLGPLLAVPALWRPLAGGLARRLALVAVAGIAAAVVVAPWVAHNLSRFEEPVYLSSGLDVTLAYSNCDPVFYGPLTGYWDFGCAPAALERSGQDTSGLDQSQRSLVWREEVERYVGDNLDRLPEVVLARIGRVAGLYKPLQQVRLDVIPEGREVWVARSGMAFYYGLAAVSFVGWTVLGRRGRWRYPLLLPLLVVALAAATTFGATRYRAAAEPALCVLAAVGLVALASLWARLRTPDAPVGDAPELAVSDGAGPGPAAPTR